MTGPARRPTRSLAGPTGRPAAAATAAELTNLLATLLDALCCAGLPADADVLAQHARAAANRLASSLNGEGLAEVPVRPAAPTSAGPSPDGPVDGGSSCAPAGEGTAALVWREWTFPTSGTVHANGLTVDIDGCCAHVEGRLVQLNAVQTRLLAALAAHPARVVPHAALVRVAWGGPRHKPSALYAQMSRLRTALGLCERTCTIRAVTDKGYRLEPRRPAVEPDEGSLSSIRSGRA